LRFSTDIINSARYAHGYYGTLIGNQSWRIDLCRFRWTWVTLKGETREIKFSGGSHNNADTVRRRTTKSDVVAHWGGLVLGSQPRPHPKRAELQRSPIIGAPFYLCVHRLSQNYQIWCNTLGGACFRESATPHPKGAELQRSQIWGSFLFMRIPFVAEVPIFTRNTNGEVACFRWWATHALTPTGGVSALPNFGVYFYLCVHPLSQNYHTWRGNTWRGGACILRSSSHPKRTEFQRSPIWGCSPVFMPISLNAERPNSAW